MRACNHEIFKKGVPVVILLGKSQSIETWVKKVAKKAKARLDWHWSGGRAQVLFLGDEKARERVEAMIDKLAGDLQEGIFDRHPGAGLYRAGVTAVPDGTIAVDPDFGPIIKSPGSN